MNFAGGVCIACRRITYQAGVRLSEAELFAVASGAYWEGSVGVTNSERMKAALAAYRNAWQVGRVFDSTLEGE